MRLTGPSNFGFAAWMTALALTGLLSATIDGALGWESVLQSIHAWTVQVANAMR